MREKIIKDIVQNPFYGEMIADTLYDGIKSFAAQSGPSNETVGGSLFNLGKGILGAALSGVSDTIDKNIKKFIADNLQKSIAKESYLYKSKKEVRDLLEQVALFTEITAQKARTNLLKKTQQV